MEYSERWEVKLNDIVDILGDGLHGTPKYSDDGEYHFINGNNLNGKITVDEMTKRVDYKEYLKYRKALNSRTILISINGTLGKIAKYNNEKVILGKSACYLCVNKNYDLDYIYYVLQTGEFKRYLQTHSTGTTIKNMGLKQLRDFKFQIPIIFEQKAIANILNSIDRKIELNNKIKKTFEEMAQAIFKSWFVDFEPFKDEEFKESELGQIPNRWEVLPISDVCNIRYGKNLPTTKLTSSGYPVYGGNGIIGSYSQYLYHDPQVIIACRGAASGKVLTTLPNSFVTNNSLVLEITRSISFEYLKLYTLNSGFEIFRTGSAQPQITIENAKYYKILVPNIEVIKKFSCIIKPLFDSSLSNFYESEKLGKIRDLLLPKLMSGEIRLSLEDVQDAKVR